MSELPWEFFFVMGTIAVTIILPVIFLVGVLDLKKRRLKVQQGRDDSLTTSELQRMIEDSVRRANDDLVQRLDRLERRLGASDSPLWDGKNLDAGTRDASEEFESPSRSIGRLRAPMR